MFFVFYILILINYVPDSSNYVLKRTSQNVAEDIKSNDSHRILQENLNTNSSPKILKVDPFNKRQSDEILPIKRNIHGRDTSTKLKITRNSINTPSSEIKQKWPNEELLPKHDIIEENQPNVDDFDFRHLFPEENDSTSMNTESPLRMNTCNHEEQQHNQSKKKVVDLRSLSGRAPSSMIDQRHASASANVSHCACSRSLVHSNWAPEYIPFSIPIASPLPHKCTSCSKTTISYSLMPIYIPYEPYINYLPNMFKEDSMRPSLDDLYYYDDNYREEDADSDDEEDEEHEKKKKKKQKKSRTHEDSVIIDINYDVKPPETEVKWNTAFFEGRPNKLVKDLMDDLIMLYPDTVIRKCYCSSSSNYYSMTLSHLAFLLFILGNVVVRIFLVQ